MQTQTPPNSITFSQNEPFNFNNLDENITEIILDNLDVTELPDFPKHISSIVIKNCGNLTKLPELPAKIYHLKLQNCTSLQILPNLPDTIACLDVENCPSLAEFPELPKNTTSLSINNLPSLTTLPELPAKIIYFNVDNCNSLTKLPKLPDSIAYLHLNNCTSLTEVPKLPAKINSLDFQKCTSLTKLPELPNSITKLNIRDCVSLRELPILPNCLNFFCAQNCQALTKLPKLPKDIKHLFLDNCTSLTELPELLDCIRSLTLSGCNSLENNHENVKKLIDLENKNKNDIDFNLLWPRHFDRTLWLMEVKKNIQEAYLKYYEGNDFIKNNPPNPDESFPTFLLIHRFITESLMYRGSEVISQQALELSKKIKEKPQLLEFLDESSKSFLAGCVNQPVAGFIEIANLAEIDSCQTIPEKLEKYRALIAMAIINDNVLQLTNKSSSSFLLEVELGNAMAIKVHEKLLNDEKISERWPGIPERIAFEGTIKSYLTKSNIDEISDNVLKNAINLSLDEVAKKMCEGSHMYFWSTQTLTKEKREELMQPYRKMIDDQYIDETQLAQLNIQCQSSIFSESKKITEEIIASLNKSKNNPTKEITPLDQESIDLKLTNEYAISAIRNKDYKIIKKLIEKNFDFKEIQNSGSLSHIALINDDPQMLKYLMDQGIKIDTYSNGATILLFACQYKKKEIAKFLIERDPESLLEVDDLCRSPIDYAKLAKNENKEIIEIINASPKTSFLPGYYELFKKTTVPSKNI